MNVDVMFSNLHIKLKSGLLSNPLISFVSAIFVTIERGTSVQKLLATGLVGVALVLTGGSVPAHHSISMFDYGSPTELEGTVQEFRYTNPHSLLILKVKGTDGRVATWTLEGMSPSRLETDGWTSKSLKPGDQIKLMIYPLRSGGTSGMWNPQSARFRDGKVVATRR